MKEQRNTYRRMIFVCTNRREDGSRPACGMRGGEEICEKLKEEVKKRGLKGKVRALKSGCMDVCEAGPNIMVYPEGDWLSEVASQDLGAVIEKYLT